jgi:hypothetical protein
MGPFLLKRETIFNEVTGHSGIAAKMQVDIAAQRIVNLESLHGVCYSGSWRGFINRLNVTCAAGQL